MPYLSTLIVSILATLSLASPVVRQVQCPPLGGSGNENNFKLLAVSKADSSITSPLAIGSNAHPSLLPGGDTYLGVTDSFKVALGDVFALDEGGMTVYDSDLTLVGVSQNVPKNGTLPFIYPGEDVYVPAEIYCSVIDLMPNLEKDPYLYYLMLNGDTDFFYLCQTDSGVLVVHNPFNAASQGIEVDTSKCTSVYIHILPEAE